MKKNSSNLPPGCNMCDIPGERPIDIAIEQLCSICKIEECPADASGDFADCPIGVEKLAQYQIGGEEVELPEAMA